MDLHKQIIEDRRSKVMSFYRAGFTVDSISKLLSTPTTTVYNDLNIKINELEASIKLNQKQLIALQYERLSYLEEKLAVPIQNSDFKAIKLGIEINHAKNKLMGIYKSDIQLEVDDFPINLDIESNKSFEIESNYENINKIEEGELIKLDDLREIDSGKVLTDNISSKFTKSSKKLQNLSDQELKDLYFNSLNELGKR